MNPQQARQHYPDVFFDDNVYEVVAAAVHAGQASLLEISGDLIYHDPYFGSDVPVRQLRYNSELGLHAVRK